MAFLDKRTRVIDIVLTDYGKDMLSKNSLELEYYSFSDDEVDYNPYIQNSGSLNDVELSEVILKQIEATLVLEAKFGLELGTNRLSKDEVNIKSRLFSIQQGQTYVPEMSFVSDIQSEEVVVSQQKIISRSSGKDADIDVGYRKFDNQHLVIDTFLTDQTNSEDELYKIDMFVSGSDGLVNLKHRLDLKNEISFSNDIIIRKDGLSIKPDISSRRLSKRVK